MAIREKLTQLTASGGVGGRNADFVQSLLESLCETGQLPLFYRGGTTGMQPEPASVHCIDHCGRFSVVRLSDVTPGFARCMVRVFGFEDAKYVCDADRVYHERLVVHLSMLELDQRAHLLSIFGQCIFVAWRRVDDSVANSPRDMHLIHLGLGQEVRHLIVSSPMQLHGSDVATMMRYAQYYRGDDAHSNLVEGPNGFLYPRHHSVSSMNVNGRPQRLSGKSIPDNALYAQMVGFCLVQRTLTSSSVDQGLVHIGNGTHALSVFASVMVDLPVVFEPDFQAQHVQPMLREMHRQMFNSTSREALIRMQSAASAEFRAPLGFAEFISRYCNTASLLRFLKLAAIPIMLSHYRNKRIYMLDSVSVDKPPVCFGVGAFVQSVVRDPSFGLLQPHIGVAPVDVNSPGDRGVRRVMGGSELPDSSLFRTVMHPNELLLHAVHSVMLTASTDARMGSSLGVTMRRIIVVGDATDMTSIDFSCIVGMFSCIFFAVE
jgi:hypothetical protein